MEAVVFSTACFPPLLFAGSCGAGGGFFYRLQFCAFVRSQRARREATHRKSAVENPQSKIANRKVAELKDVPSAAWPAEEPPVRIVEVGLDRMDVIRDLNRAVFGREHIINSFDHTDLIMLLAVARPGQEAVGFKVGYRQDADVFYSAKGGVCAGWRRRGIARLLLRELMARARRRGYARFAYDTFPNKHPGMTVMGLGEGFRVVRAGYSSRYEDYRLRFEKEL